MPDRAATATFLQGLTGLQPLVILMFLSLGGAAQTMAEMRSLTGKSADALQPALDSLIVKGWVTKQMGEHGRPSYLPGGSAFFNLLDGSLFSLAEPARTLPGQTPVLPESGSVVVDVAIGKNFSLPLQQQQLTTASQIPVLPESGKAKVDVHEKAILAALREVGRGIVGKKARMLAKLPWVTVEYVQAHAAQLKRETWDNPEGMAIYRMEENMTPDYCPPTEQTIYHEVVVDKGKRGTETIKYTFDILQEVADFMGHEKGCRCSDCKMLISVNGDTRVMCSDCKHYHCTCEVEDE